MIFILMSKELENTFLLDKRQKNVQMFNLTFINSCIIMLFASDNELQEFVENLLQNRSSEKVIKILEEQDEKLLTFTKLSMLQKMPKELCSKKYVTQSKHNYKTLQNKNIFPKMFEVQDKKVYEYINENVQNMKKIAKLAERISTIKTEKEERKISEENVQAEKLIEQIAKQDKAKEIPVDIQLKINEVEIQSESKEHKSLKSQIRSEKKSQSISHQTNISPSRLGIEPSRVNPFVPKNYNFTDQYANSKTLQTKYPFLQFNQNSRNITAIVQSAKLNAFSQSVAFPTAVMPGTILAPKQSMFSKETKLDVTDIMRYTLGVKKDQRAFTAKIQNPFQRRPKRND